MKSMFSFLLICLATSGCINRATATLAPGANITGMKSFYVVHQPRDKENLNQVIADNLTLRGLNATAGPELPLLYDRCDYNLRGQMDVGYHALFAGADGHGERAGEGSAFGGWQLLPHFTYPSITQGNDR